MFSLNLFVVISLMQRIKESENSHLFVRESITVRLTSSLIGLDLTKQVNLLLTKHNQSSWIQTGQKGGQLDYDTSPYKASECSQKEWYFNLPTDKVPLLLAWML